MNIPKQMWLLEEIKAVVVCRWSIIKIHKLILGVASNCFVVPTKPIRGKQTPSLIVFGNLDDAAAAINDLYSLTPSDLPEYIQGIPAIRQKKSEGTEYI